MIKQHTVRAKSLCMRMKESGKERDRELLRLIVRLKLAIKNSAYFLISRLPIIAARTKRLSRLHTIMLTPRGVGRNRWRGPPLAGWGGNGGGGTFRWYARIQRPAFPWITTSRLYHAHPTFEACVDHKSIGLFKELTWDLRDLGTQIIALPSREQVTILSWQNLRKLRFKKWKKQTKKKTKNKQTNKPSVTRKVQFV